MPGRHRYTTTTVWTGDRGAGTADYRAYDRTLETRAPGRPTLLGSSDKPFRGTADRWNPELLLLAALSECHLLSYLHCCATGGVVVVAYEDEAEGEMVEDGQGGGRFSSVVLRPVVTVAEAQMADAAQELHGLASQRCFIAASMNFPVEHEPQVRVRAAT
jgi:organic hydroperoxide reductase OsmC/OhrA